MSHSIDVHNPTYGGDSGIRVLDAILEGSDVTEAWSKTKESITKSFKTISKGVSKELREGLDINISESEICVGYGDLEEETRIILISSVLGLVGGIEYMIGLLWLNVEMDRLCSAAACFQRFLFLSECPDVRNASSASKVVLSILSIEGLGLNYRLQAIKTWKSLGSHFADFLVDIWPVQGTEPTPSLIILAQSIGVLVEQIRLLKMKSLKSLSPVVASCDSSLADLKLGPDIVSPIPQSCMGLTGKQSVGGFSSSLKALSSGSSKLSAFVPKAAWFDENCEPIPIDVIDAVKAIDSLQRGEYHVSSQYDCYGIDKNDSKTYDKSLKVVKSMLDINGWYKKFDPIRHPGTAIAWLNMLVGAIGQLRDECPRAMMLIVFSACDDFQEKLISLLLLPSVHRQSVKVKKQWIIGALMLEFNQFKYTKYAERVYQDIRQNTGERLTEFAARIIRAKSACKSEVFNKTDIREMIGVFVKGCSESIAGELARNMDQSIYMSLPLFVEELNRRLEYQRQVIVPETLVSSPRSDHQFRLADGSRKRSRIEAEKPRVYGVDKDGGVYICFRCGEGGHIAKHCRASKPADCHICCKRCGNRGHSVDRCRVVDVKCLRCSQNHRDSVCPHSWEEATKALSSGAVNRTEKIKGEEMADS